MPIAKLIFVVHIHVKKEEEKLVASFTLDKKRKKALLIWPIKIRRKFYGYLHISHEVG